MKLKTISIKNFRGIESLPSLPLSAINTFVGKNDSGKSTIIRALDCFFNEKNFDTKDYFKGVERSEATSIEISFDPPVAIDDLVLDQSLLLTIRKEFRLVDGKTKIVTSYRVNDFKDPAHQDLWNKKEQDLNTIMDDLGLPPRRSGRGNTNSVRIAEIKKAIEQTERQVVYHPLGDLLKTLEKVDSECRLPEFSMFDAEQDLDVGATNFQSQFKPIISAYFNTAAETTKTIEDGLRQDLDKEFEEICKFMRKNVSGLKKFNPTTEFDWTKALKKFDLSLEFEGHTFDVPISHKGSGFKRLLMVAYFEYLASKRAAQNQIFGIEEPETFLHPSAQEDLLSSIIQLSDTSQFVLTTHSPIFAGATDGENSVLVTKTAEGISRYERGTDTIISRIIEELGIRPNHNLLKQKFIIFVEGGSDVEFFNIASAAILGKNLEADGIVCMIGGGSSLANYADLDLFKKINGPGRYAVILDGDNGDEAKEREKAKIEARCLEDGALFCKLSKRDIENYCHPEAIKRVLTKEIYSSEGAGSRNPRIQQIATLQIVLEDDTDADLYLHSLGVERFKKGTNVATFKEMSLSEWQACDPNEEIKTFIEAVYQKILNQVRL